MTEIQERLFALQDEKYRTFNARLIPNIEAEKIIGVRVPELRKQAKELKSSELAAEFMAALPHEYHEENCLHGFLLEQVRDFDSCLSELESFLPYMDNWAVCDGTNPKALCKDKERLLQHVLIWLNSEHTYTVRYAMGVLMRYFLDEDFKEEYLAMVAGVRSEDYYVKMMQAWYFATALDKQYDSAIVYLQERRLSEWVHKKTIQKARESYRISDEVKDRLMDYK
jgi:3-methyladenine DNA glycosylase AlkD